jgi:CheY-like chemotaxis protein
VKRHERRSEMETIMIVDNEQYTHDFYHEMLENAEYDVINAYAGSEVLCRLKENSPVLIVMDHLVSQDMALTITGAENGNSGYIENIPVIIASDFFQQAVLVQTLLVNRANDTREIEFTCESRVP